METFAPVPAPSPGGTRKPRVALVKAEFGDGYTQSRPRGAQHITREATLRWDGLGTEEMQAIDAFLTRHGGFRPFLYRAWGDTEKRRWTCAEWEFEQAGIWRGQAVLLEDRSWAK